MNEPRPLTRAPLLAVGAHVVAPLLTTVAAFFLAGGSFSNFKQWMDDHKLMWVMLAALPVQTALGIVLAFLEARRPRLLLLHVLVPGLVAFLGLFATWQSTVKGFAILGQVSLAHKERVWLAALTAAGAPKQLALLVAAAGLLPLVALALEAFFAHRRARASLDGARSLAAALLFTVGAPASLWLLGRALTNHAFTEAMRALTGLPPELSEPLVAIALDRAATLHTLFHLLVGASAVLGVVFLGLAWRRAGVGAARVLVGFGLAVVWLGGVVVAEVKLARYQQELHDTLREALGSSLSRVTADARATCPREQLAALA